MHRRIKDVQHPDKEDKEFFCFNDHPKEIIAGIDYVELSGKESRDTWVSRRRKVPTLASTVTVVTKPATPKVPSYHTRPSSASTGTVSNPPTSIPPSTLPKDSTPVSTQISVNDLIKNLQGQVAPDVLEKAMVESSIPCSPSFSRLSEPNCEVFDTIDTVPSDTTCKSSSPLSESQLLDEENTTLEAVKSILDEIKDDSSVSPLPQTSTLINLTPINSTVPEIVTSDSPTNTPATITCDKSVYVTQATTSPSTSTDNVATVEVSSQTDSWEDFMRCQMKELFTAGMTAFANVMGQKMQRYPPPVELQGVQNSLDTTNQNLLQFAQCIEAQNKLILEERAKYSDATFLAAVKTLENSVNDLRTEFKSYQQRPVSESHHSRTATALQSVVTGINTVVCTLQGHQQLPTCPPPQLTSPEQQDFDRLLNTVFDTTTSSAPKVKSLDDRKQERARKALESTENVAPQESTHKKRKTSVEKDTAEKKKEQDPNHKKEKTQSSSGKENKDKKEKEKTGTKRKAGKGEGDELVVKRGKILD